MLDAGEKLRPHRHTRLSPRTNKSSPPQSQTPSEEDPTGVNMVSARGLRTKFGKMPPTWDWAHIAVACSVGLLAIVAVVIFVHMGKNKGGTGDGVDPPGGVVVDVDHLVATTEGLGFLGSPPGTDHQQGLGFLDGAAATGIDEQTADVSTSVLPGGAAPVETTAPPAGAAPNPMETTVLPRGAAPVEMTVPQGGAAPVESTEECSSQTGAPSNVVPTNFLAVAPAGDSCSSYDTPASRTFTAGEDEAGGIGMEIPESGIRVEADNDTGGGGEDDVEEPMVVEKIEDVVEDSTAPDVVLSPVAPGTGGCPADVASGAGGCPTSEPSDVSVDRVAASVFFHPGEPAPSDSPVSRTLSPARTLSPEEPASDNNIASGDDGTSLPLHDSLPPKVAMGTEDSPNPMSGGLRRGRATSGGVKGSLLKFGQSAGQSARRVVIAGVNKTKRRKTPEDKTFGGDKRQDHVDGRGRATSTRRASSRNAVKLRAGGPPATTEISVHTSDSDSDRREQSESGTTPSEDASGELFPAMGRDAASYSPRPESQPMLDDSDVRAPEHVVEMSARHPPLEVASPVAEDSSDNEQMDEHRSFSDTDADSRAPVFSPLAAERARRLTNTIRTSAFGLYIIGAAGDEKRRKTELKQQKHLSHKKAVVVPSKPTSRGFFAWFGLSSTSTPETRGAPRDGTPADPAGLVHASDEDDIDELDDVETEYFWKLLGKAVDQGLNLLISLDEEDYNHELGEAFHAAFVAAEAGKICSVTTLEDLVSETFLKPANSLTERLLQTAHPANSLVTEEERESLEPQRKPAAELWKKDIEDARDNLQVALQRAVEASRASKH